MVLAVALLAGFISAPSEAGEGKISGIMFGDYYWVVSADDATAEAPEKRNAFQMRRIYLTYNKGIDDDFSIRFRLEANDSGFGSGSKMIPFTKHAYLKWKKGVGSSDLYLGLSGTPTWAGSEEAWGYRAVEKTVLDLNGIGSSADIGAALKGKAGKLGYHVMVGNGPGQKPESDHGKKIYGSATFEFSEGMQVEGYADYNMRPGSKDELTLKGFAGFKSAGFQGGIEAFTRTNKKAAANGDDVKISGVSAFAALGLGESLKGFGRVDAVNNDLLLIAGLDHQPAKNVHLIPNLYIELPDGPDPSIQARVTFSYKY